MNELLNERVGGMVSQPVRVSYIGITGLSQLIYIRLTYWFSDSLDPTFRSASLVLAREPVRLKAQSSSKVLKQSQSICHLTFRYCGGQRTLCPTGTSAGKPQTSYCSNGNCWHRRNTSRKTGEKATLSKRPKYKKRGDQHIGILVATN